MENTTMMSAEEFFGAVGMDNRSVRKGKARGKRAGKSRFDELKVKMVMRIYGVPRARATEIIAGRPQEMQMLERTKAGAVADSKRSHADDDEMMSAAEFFNED